LLPFKCRDACPSAPIIISSALALLSPTFLGCRQKLSATAVIGDTHDWVCRPLASSQLLHACRTKDCVFHMPKISESHIPSRPQPVAMAILAATETNAREKN
jgi:hypothetical protein